MAFVLPTLPDIAFFAPRKPIPISVSRPRGGAHGNIVVEQHHVFFRGLCGK